MFKQLWFNFTCNQVKTNNSTELLAENLGFELIQFISFEVYTDSTCKEGYKLIFPYLSVSLGMEDHWHIYHSLCWLVIHIVIYCIMIQISLPWQTLCFLFKLISEGEAYGDVCMIQFPIFLLLLDLIPLLKCIGSTLLYLGPPMNLLKTPTVVWKERFSLLVFQIHWIITDIWTGEVRFQHFW